MIVARDKVRFVETDMMGVVHHSNYFKWFEMGRVEYLRQVDILLLDMIADGVLFPIVDVSCKYRQSARFDDVILIETTLAEVSRAKMRFTYRIVREQDGALLAEGETQNVFTSLEGKIMRLPQKYYKKLSPATIGQEF